ncbi:glycosyltransferase family 1 protein [Butyrivibrio sp. AE2005]|uniref:glycosyltransferase family 1 protein n=1 Tax=Butyrivibrio sp. AE2005 TaxID=1496722 RepID=UPI00047EF730|nr:glycosyltransferase family 1 protein [Butyrivibrio sp. AE2005]
MTESRLLNLLKGKNVVYITVKNEDYIRTSQIKWILAENAKKFRIYSSEKGNPVTRAIDIRKKLRSISFEGVDVVIAGFLPQLIWKDLIKYTLGTGIIVIAEMFISLYDTVVLDRRLVWKRGIIAHICKLFDRTVVKKSDYIITDTKADADFFVKEFGTEKDREKFETLYLEADLGDYISANVVLDKNDDAEPKTVLYFGTGLPLQGTDYVAKAFNVLAEEYGYNCIYIGGLSNMNRKHKNRLLSCKDRAIRCGKGSITYYKWLGQKELYENIANASVCLAGHFDPDIDKADRTIPGKAMIYEALGKTMILGDTKANREIFEPDDKHIFVPRGDSKRIVKAVTNEVDR